MIQDVMNTAFFNRLTDSTTEARRIAWGSNAEFESNITLANLVILVDDALLNGLSSERIESLIDGMNDSNFEHKAMQLKRMSLIKAV